ncbi:family 2 encapsulin nanocompartment cargo protein polyprenyl transferase [Kitasatospora albolonga]|uniref:polyprenyl synthetase family protein n=1 Tax=Kitasatospora albolonga TaxID=68173 RepID=UPI0031EA9499
MATTWTDQHENRTGFLLDRARDLADNLLRSSLGELPPRMLLVSGYQLGWWDAEGVERATGSGKALRPALALAAAKAVGGRLEDAVPAAAAVELAHNFSLVHDDVVDRDETRRHRPTAWKAFGTADAIMAGDAMLAMTPRVLARHEHPQLAESLRRLGVAVAQLCEGQHLDCSFERRATVSVDDCLTMAEAKTGALLGASCALGALSGGAPPGVVAAFDSFGRQLGLAFQLVDDLLGIWGDPAVTGKPVGADLRVRKKSLPVVATLAMTTEPARRLRALYSVDRPLSAAEVERATQVLEEAGGRMWAQDRARRHLLSALDTLDSVLPSDEDSAELRALSALITRRRL